MTDSEDFTFEWTVRSNGKTTNGTITDVRFIRGKALYRLPWWQRWLMPWRWFHVWRKPTAPFPSTEDQP
jgi:hypothetical protein